MSHTQTISAGPIAPDAPRSPIACDKRKPHPAGRAGRRPVWLMMLIGLAAVIGVLVVTGIRSRRAAELVLAHAAERAATPSVEVIHPQTGATTLDLVLPGDLRPHTLAPIYSRATGYIKKWYVDIGAKVHAGQLLAEIETPELDEQLEQARADLDITRANLTTAALTAERWRLLLESDSVSKQETEEFIGKELALQAALASSAANVRRIERLVSYQRIVAPFDGVIITRLADTGALVDADANAPGKELYDLASIHVLRLYLAVPERFAQAAQPGLDAVISLDAYPGEVFRAKIVRNAFSIDPTSRTLLSEIDIENADARLMPGAYAVVRMSLPAQPLSLSIPSSALIFQRAGAQVAVVRAGRVRLTAITIGRDYGRTLEVVSGLDPTDQIIANPSDSLVEGMRVRVQSPPVAREVSETAR